MGCGDYSKFLLRERSFRRRFPFIFRGENIKKEISKDPLARLQALEKNAYKKIRGKTLALYNLTGGDLTEYENMLKKPIELVYEWIEIKLINEDKQKKKLR